MVHNLNKILLQCSMQWWVQMRMHKTHNKTKNGNRRTRLVQSNVKCSITKICSHFSCHSFLFFRLVLCVRLHFNPFWCFCFLHCCCVICRPPPKQPSIADTKCIHLNKPIHLAVVKQSHVFCWCKRKKKQFSEHFTTEPIQLCILL